MFKHEVSWVTSPERLQLFLGLQSQSVPTSEGGIWESHGHSPRGYHGISLTSIHKHIGIRSEAFAIHDLA